ncbi:radical SAM protein [Candidatus Microgenomates bacterium]|nr:MAG: radical SAM protein [Candidatus Microgenomates bacterium]
MNKIAKKKIVLFSSNTRYVGSPLSLLSITRLLDLKKYDVKIITKNEYSNFEEEVVKQCEGAVCLGITTITGFPIKIATRVSQKVKEKYPKLPIIWGGWQPTTLPEETLKAKFVDYICMGQGDRAFPKFVEAITSGNLSELSKIVGLGFKKGRKIILNPRSAIEDIDNLPDFSLDLINWEKYLEVTDFGKRVIRIYTSYGCPYRCAFCCEPFNSKRRWKSLSAKRVIGFLIKLKKKVNFDGIIIVDNNFFINEQRVIDICKGLIKNKFKIKFGHVNGRTNHLVKYSPEVWKLMKKAGLFNILIGAESGNEETLVFINKDATVEQTLKLAEICNKFKILLVASTIVGLPTKKYFTNSSLAFQDDLNEVIELYNKICKVGSIHHLLTFFYTPLPFSQLYTKAIELGFKPPVGLDNWSDYELSEIHVPWIPKDGFQKVLVLNYISLVVGIDFKYLLASVPPYIRIVIKPILEMFKNLGKWRFNSRYLGFPVDMWTFRFGANLFTAMNKKFRMVNIGG